MSPAVRGLLGAVLLACLLPARSAEAVADRCATTADFRDLRGSVVLPSGCVWRANVRILTSGTRLDCRGSVFDGEGQLPIGLSIHTKTTPLQDVEVRDCTFRNFSKRGIHVELRADTRDRERSQRLAPRDITITGVTVERAGSVGIYLDDYVARVTVRDSTIRQSTGAAIYLDQGSRDNRLINNRFVANGFRPDGSRYREAVAIDSSAHNEIRGNRFEGNARGGVFLYKNCGEKASSGRSPIRWQHSDRNLIAGNTFVREPVGIWIASRQSTNLRTWDCSDPPMDPQGRYFEDYADDNEVRDNRFCEVPVPVRIEGDRNRVVGNRYDQRADAAAELPVSQRARWLGRPATGNVVEDNHAADCTAEERG